MSWFVHDVLGALSSKTKIRKKKRTWCACEPSLLLPGPLAGIPFRAKSMCTICAFQGVKSVCSWHHVLHLLSPFLCSFKLKKYGTPAFSLFIGFARRLHVRYPAHRSSLDILRTNSCTRKVKLCPSKQPGSMSRHDYPSDKKRVKFGRAVQRGSQKQETQMIANHTLWIRA